MPDPTQDLPAQDYFCTWEPTCDQGPSTPREEDPVQQALEDFEAQQDLERDRAAAAQDEALQRAADAQELKQFHTEVSQMHAEKAEGLAWTGGVVTFLGNPALGLALGVVVLYEKHMATEHANAAAKGEKGPLW